MILQPSKAESAQRGSASSGWVGRCAGVGTASPSKALKLAVFILMCFSSCVPFTTHQEVSLFQSARNFSFVASVSQLYSFFHPPRTTPPSSFLIQVIYSHRTTDHESFCFGLMIGILMRLCSPFPPSFFFSAWLACAVSLMTITAAKFNQKLPLSFITGKTWPISAADLRQSGAQC